MDGREGKGIERAVALLGDVTDGTSNPGRWSDDEVCRAVDQVLDQLTRLTAELDVHRTLLAGCAQNAAEERRLTAEGLRRIGELEAELAGTVAVVVNERERNEVLMHEILERDRILADLRSQVAELAPYKVSPKYQLRALRSTLPLAARKRFPLRVHGRGSVDS